MHDSMRSPPSPHLPMPSPPNSRSGSVTGRCRRWGVVTRTRCGTHARQVPRGRWPRSTWITRTAAFRVHR
jgi:hypothetical protein